jgi:hypothetical protein
MAAALRLEQRQMLDQLCHLWRDSFGSEIDGGCIRYTGRATHTLPALAPQTALETPQTLDTMKPN